MPSMEIASRDFLQEPKFSGFNPLAIRTLNEIGIDISHHRSKAQKEFIDIDIDLVIISRYTVSRD